MTKYIFNPNYILRHEGNKTYIMGIPNSSGGSKICVIHPIYAMMLTFFNNTEFDIAIDNISSFFKISKDRISSQMHVLLDNSDPVSDGSSTFPQKTLVEYKDSMPLHHYSPMQFEYSSPDIKISRLKFPNDIVCNVTMKCHTSCFYCYANRKGNMNKTMKIELLERIIEEAKRIGVIRFELIGGEVLLYEKWERFLEKLFECGFHPWMSTKIPLTEEQILKIKSLNFNNSLQVSIDTLIKQNMYEILNISDPYYESLIKSFELMEKHKLNYSIHTVLNSKNDSINDIRSIVNFFKNKKYISSWNIDPAKCSMYIGTPYSEYRITEEKLLDIRKYVSQLNSDNIFKFKIIGPTILRNINDISIEEKKRIFNRRTLCSANLNALYILPDGKVTICEELYWHPRFILGDLNYQTIEEIWNSPKAQDLYFLKQSEIQKKSPCSTCEDYASCRDYRQVCWRDVVSAYGNDNWDFPDIFCPKAPYSHNTIFV